MVVNKVVYKERIIAIQCVMVTEIIGNLRGTVDRQEVGTSSNSIKVNYFDSRLSSLITF